MCVSYVTLAESAICEKKVLPSFERVRRFRACPVSECVGFDVTFVVIQSAPDTSTVLLFSAAVTLARSSSDNASPCCIKDEWCPISNSMSQASRLPESDIDLWNTAALVLCVLISPYILSSQSIGSVLISPSCKLFIISRI